MWRPRFHGDFAAYIERLIAETPVRVGDDLAGRWKAALAAEEAKAPA